MLEQGLKIRDLWASVLNRDPTSLSVDDDFVHMGGDLLSSIHLVTAARENGMTLQSQ